MTFAAAASRAGKPKRPNPDKPLTTNQMIALFREILERDEAKEA